MARLFRWLRFVQRLEFALLLLAPLVIAFAVAVADAREMAQHMQVHNNLFQHSGDHGDSVELDAQLHVVKVGSCPLCSPRHPIPYCHIKRGPNYRDWEDVPWWMLPETTRQEVLYRLGTYKSMPRYRSLYDSFHAPRPPKQQ